MKVRTSLLCSAALVSSAAVAQGREAAQAALSPAAASTAAVQDGDASEIVVTALRRNTTLQRTPASVTALSGAEIASRGISNVEDLAAVVPGVSFGRTVGQAHISIRGIGSDAVVAGQDPRVAFYQDNVYLARPDAQVAGMFDVASVQVLKGPQGTLYGRNATGGAVVVTSARPTDTTEGYLRLGYGNYNAVKVEAAVSGPLSDTLSIRVAMHYDRHDGYGKNIVTGHHIDDKDEVGTRVSLLWKPTDKLELLTIADYSNENDRSSSLHYFGPANSGVTPKGLLYGGTALLNSRDIASDIDPQLHLRTWGIAEQATYNADWVTIKSVTAYRRVRSSNVVDIDGSSVQLAYDNLFDKAEQFSEELNITGKIGRFSWLGGGQYFYEDIGPAGAAIPISLTAAANLPMVLPLSDAFYGVGFQKTYGIAAYGQLSYEIADGLKITAGGRYSTEKKKLHDNFQLDFSRPYNPNDPIISQPGFPRRLENRFSKFTPNAMIEYQANKDIFLYFSYGQGFKSGGYSFGVLQPAYRPETITSYEGGIKSTWLSGTLTANLIGFHYDYKDLQVNQIRGNVSVTENAASARVNGFEAEIAVRPVHSLTIGGNFAYTDAKYKDFMSIDPSNPAAGVQDLSGYTLAQAPKTSFSLYAANTWKTDDYDITARFDYNYTGHQYFTPFDSRLVDQGAYGVASFSLKAQARNGVSVEGYIRNIGNTKAIAQTYVSSVLFGYPVLGTLIAPRTYGLTLGYDF